MMHVYTHIYGRIYINEILYNCNILFNLFFFLYKQKDIIFLFFVLISRFNDK